MSVDVTLLIFYLCLALGVSFLCSVLEAVLLSITPGYVAALEKQGDRVADGLKKLKEEVDRPLSAILSLNTIAHTVGAAGVGAQATKVFGDVYLGLTSGVLTVLILFVSEIVPKSLGASYWKQLAPWVTRVLGPLTFLMTVTGFVPVSRWITSLLGGGHGSVPSREEISAIAEEGARQGLFLTGESRVLGNLFRLASLQATDVMTPRTVLFALPEASTVADFMERVDEIPFSRIPVHTGSLDAITGYVLKHEVLLRAARDEHALPLREFRRDLVAIPASLKLSDLFERLLEEQAQLVLLVDEYGGTTGIVTMEDLVETLLGLEIVDEADEVVDLRELARRQWQKRASRMGVSIEKIEGHLLQSAERAAASESTEEEA